ncbi:hypothetical protein GCK32_007004, partial [Trichostrongylus colubriformis]
MKLEAAPVNLVARSERDDRGTPRQSHQRPSSPLRRRGGRQDNPTLNNDVTTSMEQKDAQIAALLKRN